MNFFTTNCRIQLPALARSQRRTRRMNRPFPHSTSLRANNSTRARLGWTFSYICCIFVHPNLDMALLFVGMRERSIINSCVLPHIDKKLANERARICALVIVKNFVILLCILIEEFLTSINPCAQNPNYWKSLLTAELVVLN